MPPKRRIDSTIDSFFKKVDRDGEGHGREQNNSPVVCPQLDQGAMVEEEALNPDDQRTAEEAPRQPAPKVQRINAEIADASVLIVERDPGLRRQIWEYHANERDQVRKVYMMHGPYQFHMDTYPSSGPASHPRRFQSHWFTAFPWLEYSPAKDAAFCFPCFLFSKKPSGKAGSDTFIVKGFNNWKKVNDGANCSLLVHMGNDSKSAHNFNMKCYDNLKNTVGHIEHVLQKQTQEDIRKNRLRLGTSIDAVRYLAFQGCSFRGRDESATSKNQGLLLEMLRSTRKSSKSTWKVLIMDKLTVKIMSFSCKMADITEEGVSLVEDLYKRRQPLPSMDAIYFMQPTKENVRIFMSDMSGKNSLYKKAYVFFSSPVQRELVAHIKKDSTVLTRISALSEMNLEYFAIDSQGFITDHDKALEELFSEDAEGSHKYNACLNTMATRIATVFASLREFPRVHYRVARTIDASTLTTLRDLVPTKLAAAVWNSLARYKSTIPEFPQTETCELLIVDRSIDQIAPIIHEWTYDAMCHDLLCMDGNKYVQEVPSKNGSANEKKEVLLEDHDPVWLELRHAHIADANERLHEKMTSFVSKNKAAQLQQARSGGELSTKQLQKMVQALPQYSDQIDKLTLHVEIAGKLNNIIKEQHLKDVGQLEQDLVFGDAGTKELISFLRTRMDVSRENKLRLLMIYASINPEKFFESEKGAKLMQLAGLSADDMIVVNNMRCLRGPDTKKSSVGAFTLKFDLQKKKPGIRKERIGEESTWMLSRFYPILEDLIEKLSKGELPKDEYHCMNDPSPSFRGIPGSTSAQTSPAHQPAQSMRSRRIGGTWARPRNSDDGYSSDSVLKHASSDLRKLGQRLFIFVIGGATRSELRVAHKLSGKLKREIILGSSSLDDPPQFITKLKMLSTEELSLDDLQI